MRAKILLTCCLIAGCASSPAPNSERLDTAFRAIQRSEAQIEAAARRLDEVASSIASDADACVERCAPLDQAIAQAREGVAGVCETAAGLDDADARTRCERARDRSSGLEQRTAELRGRCGCGAVPDRAAMAAHEVGDAP